MELSLQRKLFSEFFSAFPKVKFNFEHFQKKNNRHSQCLFEFMDSENVVR